MEYQVVFDISHVSDPLTKYLVLGLVLIIVGGGMVYLRTVLRGIGGLHVFILRGLSFFVLGFGILWTIATGDQYRRYLLLRQELSSGRAEIYEGKVRQFVPMPPARSGAEESFVVAGKRFTYSDYVITGCFNNSSLFNGPIREGIAVRLWATDHCILRLEIAKS